MERALIFVRGRVQGVGFRWWTRARALELDKPPGMAEVIDWVSALGALGVSELTDERAGLAMSALAKSPDDRIELGRALSLSSSA